MAGRTGKNRNIVLVWLVWPLITLGIYLFGFGTAAFLLALMSTLGKPFFSVLLGVAVIRMVLAGYYNVGGSHEWAKVSGGFAIALAALAMYGAAALSLEDARQVTASSPPRERTLAAARVLFAFVPT